MNQMSQRKFKATQTDKENADPTLLHKKSVDCPQNLSPMKLPQFKF